MKHILFLSFLIFSVYGIGQTKNVLFIGNSFTMNYQMPKKLERIAKREGESLYTAQVTTGGKDWAFHAKNPQTYEMIKAEPWDYVILQALSYEPLYAEHQLKEKTLKYGEIIIDSVRRHHPNAKILLFMTWGYKDGIYIEYERKSIEYEEMQERLQKQYNRFSEMYKVAVAPVGKVWEKTRDQYPNYNLYASDDYHQSELGSFLIASTFYSMIFNKSIQDYSRLPYKNVDEIEARYITSIVNEVTLHPKMDWGRKYWEEDEITTLKAVKRVNGYFYNF
ncbi:DUF4886 domain-containing protein [Brumimicrobium glaciale]|jgi:hypothetical protein|uniref:DUF4886 domain-containing protein n=1 Tax=Brumimicrobium glaciale TaxID=200475 RepID=A0A4Q4KT06_9FLAO|nr:DUF4886 domain-containing protein [Brumimicrobium glaciale]RYM35849.1 DUF4886 domain-containing protein [Brumimicrobium glaciale]